MALAMMVRDVLTARVRWSARVPPPAPEPMMIASYGFAIVV